MEYIDPKENSQHYTSISELDGRQFKLGRGDRRGLVVRKNVLLEMKQEQRGKKSKWRKNI